LAACASVPLYGPRASEGGAGYAEQALDANQVRVSFTGTRFTSRERVEAGLFLRAAEITTAGGFTHCTILEQDIEARDRPRYDPFWGPGWGPRWSWGYDPFWRSRAWAGGGVYWGWTSDRQYTASATVMLMSAGEAVSRPEALRAEEVIANLAPQFQEKGR
jgi:hypothetical protein